MRGPANKARADESRTSASLVGLLAAFIVGACGGGSPAASLPPGQADDPPVVDTTVIDTLRDALAGLEFADFLEESYRQLSLRDPEFVVRNGLSGQFGLDEVLLTNVSEEYRLVTLDMMEVTLEALLANFDAGQLSASEKVSYDVYKIYLEGELEGRDYLRYRYWAADGLFGEQASTEQFFTDQHPLETRADADAYVARLALVPQKLRQIIANLDKSAGVGIVEPSLTMNIALNSINGFLGLAAAQNPYYTAFSERISAISSLSDSERSALRDSALAAVSGHVIPAYRDLQAKLNELLASAPARLGYGQYPGGKAYYDYILSWYTTTGLTADEIHALGQQELARIQAQMRAAFDDLGYPGNETLAQSFARLEAEGGIVPRADIVAINESIIATARAVYGAAFDVQAQQEVEVIGGPSCCYYVAGSVDGSRPGAFYVALADTPYYQIPTTAYHEAIPGHHLQLSVARQTDLPTFRNHIYSGAYIEGWGLYAEILAAELGWYEQDPIGELGRLQAEAIRAVRLVVDTGIHDRGWGFNRAADYYAENTGLPLSRGQGAAIRFALIPGQAATYMIGSLKILELRQRAIDQLGGDFDLAEFHSVVLQQGALPLPVLETVVDNYIAGKLP